jgi:hypothetical protein
MEGVEMRGTLKGRLRPTILAVVVLALVGGDARALTLRSTNLVDLIRQSNSILKGYVTTVTDGVNEVGFPYTEITVQIEETIRGTESGTYTFRQFGLLQPRLTPDGTRMMPAAPEGIPKYEAGERVLLFLGQAARMTGLRSTTGLGYGKFVLGAGRAENDLGNDGVFRNISLDDGLTTSNDQRILETSQGAVNPDDLLSLVQRAVSEAWVETCKMWSTDVGKTCGGKKAKSITPTKS